MSDNKKAILALKKKAWKELGPSIKENLEVLAPYLSLDAQILHRAEQIKEEVERTGCYTIKHPQRFSLNTDEKNLPEYNI